jgi:hypothetical protein
LLSEHVSTAWSFEAEIVHDFFFGFAVFDAFLVFVVEVGDWFSAAEASYWDYHRYR